MSHDIDATADVIVIGGGIAGVSVAYELSDDRRVVLLEREPALAFHTTGRSAALFLESYGNRVIRGLTTASRDFLTDPPDCFDRPLLTPRPLLQFARVGRGDALRSMFAEVATLTPNVELLTPTEAVALFGALRPETIDAALHEPGSMEIDVHALHQGYLRGLRARGGAVATSAGVASLRFAHGLWEVVTTDGDVIRAPVVVDAAGAWADELGHSVGATPIGLTPRRRTVFMLAMPDGLARDGLPTISDIDESFYLKPDGAQLLCSPADETPTPPSDARPDDLEIARALDEIAEVTTIGSRHVRSSWAGLRSFVPDRTPVAGPDPDLPGFSWCAGQGGYGIQTCAALARVTAALIRGQDLPGDVTSRGVSAGDLLPSRGRG
ncbi:NAD(P)/FAD-dependent oxidoreductase [Williamsia phyllosphaerae]|uniref:Glycerol-3-phosphate dehydrogenase n=1 Tax=Williamsia phyllosphaerae TaxID=885042 RepID=A0ABQ1V1I1_9NOCA|nr:FAD-dependent oxidoreductase [Williamsia phyllosphaerae]GGF34508.1 glycerol-3-phosphate dehydrogenase [Williamsia phyllosphaerae]